MKFHWFLSSSLFLCACVLALFVSLAPKDVQAQGYGSIQGNVADATGAAVTGATVTVKQTDTGRLTTINSGQTGGFLFPSLPPSNYSLSAHGQS